MALTYVGCSGAEFGLSGTVPTGLGWTVGGTPTTDGTTKRTGSFAFKFLPANLGTAFLSHIPAAAERIWVQRAYINFASLPASDYDILKYTVTTGTNATVQFKTASSQLAVGISSTPTTLFGPNPLVTGVWYCIEFVLDRSGATASCWARVDQGTATNVTLSEAATDITAVRLGDGSTAHNNGTNGFYADDWAYAKATAPPEWIGAGQVARVLPVAVGTHSLGSATFRKVTNETTPSATTIDGSDADSHTYIDDWPLLTGTSGDWIDLTTTAPAGTEYVEHTLTQNAVGASDTINVATGRAAIRNVSATTANVWVVRVVDGGSNRDVASGTVGSATTIYRTLSFTVADLTALNGLKLRTGLSTDGSPNPWLQAFLLEVDYAPAAVTTLPPLPFVVDSAVDRTASY